MPNLIKKKSMTVSRNQHLGIQKFGILASESLIHTEDIYIQIGAYVGLWGQCTKNVTTKHYICKNHFL